LNPFQISNYNRYFKYKKIETQLVKKADLIIAISEKEKITMSNIINPNKIIVVSNIHYSKIKLEEVISFKERNDLLFIGSTHTPNIDAVNYLFKEIMPLVWKKNPIIKVNIIGNLNEKIKDLNHPNCTFLGYVENIEPYFLKSKIMIAPLRYGAGVKGKIGQAYEYFLPVITTDIGAEGMNLKHNENAIIVNTPEAFANQILNLYDNEILWTKLSKSAASVLENFSKEELTAKLKQFN
jgi:glycosyltransferase involved in cell wall biosynthesis